MTARSIAVLAALILLSVPAAAQKSPGEGDPEDQRAVRAAVRAYFDGMMRYDRAALYTAFHPDARLLGAPDGALLEIPFVEWAKFTEKEGAQHEGGHRNRIVWVDVAGDVAVAKVDLEWPSVHYVDYLSLLRLDGEWKIVNKTWFQEPRGEPAAARIE